jgi:hypothetical protein
MANHLEFNKIKNKLDGRHFYAKNFFDMYGHKILLDPNEVYLKFEVDAILKMLKEKFGLILDDNKKLKEENENLKIENYRLQKQITKDLKNKKT